MVRNESHGVLLHHRFMRRFMRWSPTQTKEFDCGIVACEYLSALHGKPPIRRELAAQLGATSAIDGTPHYGIQQILRDGYGFEEYERVGRISMAKIPSIINYQWDGDGHYGVLVA